jgi:aspartate kinase
MQVFKFGGASVKDAEGVMNLVNVLNTVGHDNTLVVVSAMGKTTNALEEVIDLYFNTKHKLQSSVQEVRKFHNNILLDLFENERHPVFHNVELLFQQLDNFFEHNKSPDYNFVYDQVVGFGELVSTTIISHYLNHIGIKNKWLDVREFIKTDTYNRNAKVKWDHTLKNISSGVDKSVLNITQGFLGSDSNNFTTTLGREGSDYTAAIFAYALNAKSVTIWKDVPGVLNADPRYFDNATLINAMSYSEAIELSFYGATVIHPKTLQPLQRKEIPLFVKSFVQPSEAGTTVAKELALDPLTPCYILKKNQVLISLSSLDFSYIVEENISHIFSLLHLYKMKVSMIQNSAISFSVCVENTYGEIDKLLLHLKAKYRISAEMNVNLYTIRHFTTEAIKDLEKEKTVFLKQLTPKTVQIVTN